MPLVSSPTCSPISAAGEVPSVVEASPRRCRLRCARRGHRSESGLPVRALGPTRAGRWSETHPSARPLPTEADPQDQPVAGPPAPRAAGTHRSVCPVVPLPACRPQAEGGWPGLDACVAGARRITQPLARGVRGVGWLGAPPAPTVRLWADTRSLPHSPWRSFPVPLGAGGSCRPEDRHLAKRRRQSGVAPLRGRHGVSLERRSCSQDPPLVAEYTQFVVLGSGFGRVPKTSLCDQEGFVK
jgi:hypothetical protein